MMQTGRWKYAFWCVIAFTPFIVASSEKIWGLLIELPGIKDFFKAHPIIENCIRFGQGLCSIVVTLWQAWRFVGTKDGKETHVTPSDNFGVKQIPIEIGKSKKIIYIQPYKYADNDSARCKVVDRLSLWKKNSSDVIVLYSSRSSGRRETACRAIPNKMYPLYQITFTNKQSSFDKDVADVVMHFVSGTSCRHPTFLINCAHVFGTDEIVDLYTKGEKLCKTLEKGKEKVIAHIVFLCACNETLYDSRADWAFQFEPLNSVESDRFLQEVSAELAIKYADLDAYALAKNLYAGWHLEAAENFARGNPSNLFRFLEQIAFEHEFPNPLDAVQNEWQKRWRHLKDKEDSFQKLILAVLHLLIAFYREAVNEIPLSDFLRCIFNINRLSEDELRVKNALQEILGLRDVSLSPFSFRDVILPDHFCDEFLFACGEFGRMPFHDDWQLVVDRLFTHSELKSRDYAETYCRAMVNATIRCKLTHALPYHRAPSQLYRIIDRAILKVVFSGAQKTRREAEVRRGQICSMLRDRCAEEVAEFLAERIEILRAEEVSTMIAEDIDGYARNPCEWISRALSLALFQSELEPDPMCWWCVSPNVNTPQVTVNYFAALRGKISALLEDGSVLEPYIDKAWVLCWMLQGWLNNMERPFAFTKASEWNDFLGDAMSRLETRSSIELRNAVETVNALSKGGANDTVESLGLLLREALKSREHAAQTFYIIFRGFNIILNMSENGTQLLKKFMTMLRDAVGCDAKERLAPALSRLLKRGEFGIAWHEAVRIVPSNPEPKDIEVLFPRLRKEMDKICAGFNIDAEKTPAFLVNVAASVVALQARFQDNHDYEEAFLKSWGQLNAAILERFYAFTERDWFRFMITVQHQIQFLAQEIREKYISIWEAALKKIQESESGSIQISSSELGMFLSTCTCVFNDAKWASRTQGHIVNLAMRGVFPSFLTDTWKSTWIQALIATAICANPQFMVSAMFRVAGAAEQSGDSPTWDYSRISPACQDGLAMGISCALQNAQTNLSAQIGSLLVAQRTEYLSWWTMAFQSILLPYFDYMEKRGDWKRESIVVSAAVLFIRSFKNEAERAAVDAEKYVLDAKTIEGKLLCKWEKLTSELGDEVFNHVENALGIDSDSPQFFLKCIEHFESMPQGILAALRFAAQSMPKILEGLDVTDELSKDDLQDLTKVLKGWYYKIRELYVGLTEEALARGGQCWYNELMRAFAKCRTFGEVSPELAKDAKEYVRAKQAISKRR